MWHLIKKQPYMFIGLFFVSFMWPLDATLWPLLLQKTVDIFTKYELHRNSAWEELKIVVILGCALWIVVQIGFCCMGYLFAKALPKVEADIRLAMFDHIQHHSPKYFNEHFAGSLANKITDMASEVSTIFKNTINTILPACIACIASVVIFFEVNAAFATLLAVWLILHFAICFFFQPICQKYQSEHAETRSTLLGKIVDSFTNNLAVNAFYRFAQEKSFITSLQQQEKEKHFQARKSVEIMRAVQGLFCFLGAGLGLNGYMLYCWLHGTITSGEAVLIFNGTWNITMIAWMVGFELAGYIQSIGIARQALTLMNDPKDIIDAPTANPLHITQGEIVFDNVTFQYGHKKLFQNKHVVIKGGERVGIVGYSGAGKSTFVNLIMRFFPLQQGSILIDKQEITAVTFASLRQQIAFIPQDPILFHRSLKENILFGLPQASEEDFTKATRLAHCDEFIKKMPHGYDSIVGERGTKLSGGERQRIAIARAILANAPILILDEATSALDSVTEKYIQESLHWLMQKRTTVVIAHRLSTLKDMERILVFQAGVIVEEGSHEVLLAKGGHYARMWNMQAGGFLPDTPQA